jgi:hypothetical protein
MNTRLLLILVFSLSLASCSKKPENSKNSDGSNKTTYSSCTITESSALYASDRATDVRQCWDGVDYKEKSLAQTWCGEKVNTYMGKYIFGHAIKYQVTSTNCP